MKCSRKLVRPDMQAGRVGGRGAAALGARGAAIAPQLRGSTHKSSCR